MALNGGAHPSPTQQGGFLAATHTDHQATPTNNPALPPHLPPPTSPPTTTTRLRVSTDASARPPFHYNSHGELDYSLEPSSRVSDRSRDAVVDIMADIPPYPLYNRTYNLYRISPLHHGDTPLLGHASLRIHAKRLKEQLKGDNVRGVQVDFAAAEDTAKLGPLDECSWDLLGDEDAWIDRHVADVDESQLSSVLTHENARGLQISLDYEKQSYNALLLRDPAVTCSPDGFTSLPLLLVKMPGPVRDIFVNYLRTTFDAHVAPLRLPSSFISSSLETYFKHLTAKTSTQSIQQVIRQLHIQFAFPNTTTLLKHVEITIAGTDVAGFVHRGRLLKNTHTKPFTAALFAYLKHHLALDASHPNVQISRISCNSFSLGTERLKLIAPDTLADMSFSDEGGASQDASAGQLAVHELYTSLVREATGSGQFLSEELAKDHREDTPSSRRKRAISNAATGNGNNKKTKARGKENGKFSNGAGT
ncbi:CENP-L domain containing protein [Pyrenophora teres f. maculata]|nr:CENP-L domain containing protein [Pyrenophora teres f. maculata]